MSFMFNPLLRHFGCVDGQGARAAAEGCGSIRDDSTSGWQGQAIIPLDGPGGKVLLAAVSARGFGRLSMICSC